MFGLGIYIGSVNDSVAAKVGIGTTTPAQKLHVVGSARITGAFYDSNNDPGTSGQILTSTATGTDWKTTNTPNGTFNADQLSYNPATSAYLAVPANRASVVLNSGTATVAESVTEIVCKTGASTVNLNYTPGADFNDPFTTVRWIYNLQAITSVTVQTSQSWSFSSGVGSGSSFSIPAGPAAKLIWSQADNVFYYKLIP